MKVVIGLRGQSTHDLEKKSVNGGGWDRSLMGCDLSEKRESSTTSYFRSWVSPAIGRCQWLLKL